mgnify:CR=1 FL=1
MMKRIIKASASCILLALVACSGDDGGGARTANEELFYSNGPLSTGKELSNGEVAPAGMEWSEMQEALGLTQFGISANEISGYWLGDDFIVPENEKWTIENAVFYVYQTGYFNELISPVQSLKLEIYRGSPFSPQSEKVYGDMAVESYTDGVNAKIYRTIIPADKTRLVYKQEDAHRQQCRLRLL